jgi:hypothetical protein
MLPISYAGHQFPSVISRHGVWLYLRFTLSYRDVEDLLAERGLDVSSETIRRWVLKVGPDKAAALRLIRKLLKKQGFAPPRGDRQATIICRRLCRTRSHGPLRARAESEQPG